MRKIITITLFVIGFVLLVLTSMSEAKEIPLGKTRDFSIAEQKWLAHFSKMEGRICHVDLFEKKDNQTFFYKHFDFDYARGEVTEWIGKKRITIFYVEKGVIILVDGEEM